MIIAGEVVPDDDPRAEAWRRARERGVGAGGAAAGTAAAGTAARAERSGGEHYGPLDPLARALGLDAFVNLRVNAALERMGFRDVRVPVVEVVFAVVAVVLMGSAGVGLVMLYFLLTSSSFKRTA